MLPVPADFARAITDLHGGLHHDDILRAARQPWLAIGGFEPALACAELLATL